MMFYWWRQRRKLKRDPLGTIRREFALWGYSFDDMTDEELTDALMKAAHVIGTYGNSVQRAYEGFRMMYAK